MADILPVFGDEDAMACQVLEIIGGITPKALQTLEEPCREADVWSMEEGDDSVFYSDEDTPQQEAILEPRRPVNSEAEIPLGEDEQEEEKVSGNYNVDAAQETIRQENEKEELFKMETEHELESANPSTTASGIIVSTCEEALQLNNIDSEKQSSSKDFTPSSKITKDPLVSALAATTVHHQPLEVYREPGKSHSDSQDDPSEGRSIPSLSKKKSSHPKSFNHLTSSKYSTTSYRRIRRGNTRQKIEEFEYMIMNL